MALDEPGLHCSAQLSPAADFSNQRRNLEHIIGTPVTFAPF